MLNITKYLLTLIINIHQIILKLMFIYNFATFKQLYHFKESSKFFLLLLMSSPDTVFWVLLWNNKVLIYQFISLKRYPCFIISNLLKFSHKNIGKARMLEVGFSNYEIEWINIFKTSLYTLHSSRANKSILQFLKHILLKIYHTRLFQRYWVMGWRAKGLAQG